MTFNGDFRSWVLGDLQFRSRLNAHLRSIPNHIFQGFSLADGGGLTVLIGQDGPNYAYINGFEIESLVQLSESLTDNATNHVFLGFTETEDPENPTGGPQAVVVDVQVNTTGTSPGVDYFELGQVTTSGGSISSINLEDNARVFDGTFNVEKERTFEVAVASKTIDKEVTAADTSGGGFTLTLPDATTASKVNWDVKKITSDPNTLTIDTIGSQTIDGEDSVQVVDRNTSFTFFPDGLNWIII